MTTIAGLASNRGRNLRHIHRLEPGGASLGVVVSNNADAPILEWADDHDIPAVAIERPEGQDRTTHEERIIEALEGYDLDLVCLDGYMRILTETFLETMPISLNVHPSLLPNFPGMDAWGEALEAGVRVSGCTVHVVTEAVDAGPIVTQEPVPVRTEDTVETLKERILYEGEFVAYPRAVEAAATGGLSVDFEANTASIEGDDGGDLPARALDSADRRRTLRYGENPHQRAALYERSTTESATVVGASQLNEGAKSLSYNNYNDADAALNLVREFEAPTAAVIKHTNPAGCGSAETISTAYDKALRTDPMSAYGGIVALNRPCDVDTAEAIIDSFKEVVVAPTVSDDALSILSKKENLRVLEVGPLGEAGTPNDMHRKHLHGGHLRQDRDGQHLDVSDLEVVTEREPTQAQFESMLFAWQTVKHVKSNAIVFASGTETVGIGAGQMSRVDAVKIAARKANESAEGKDATGGVMASDAFFPFPDGIEEAANAGIEAVIQPGGSVNDEAVIEAANDLGVTMVFTGQRCFRHD